MDFNIKISNLAPLKSVDWTPNYGVNLVIGPNGSGKTTLMRALMFFADAREATSYAIEDTLGIKFIRQVLNEPTRLELTLLDLRWIISIETMGGLNSEKLAFTEQIYHAGKELANSQKEACYPNRSFMPKILSSLRRGINESKYIERIKVNAIYPHLVIESNAVDTLKHWQDWGDIDARTGDYEIQKNYDNFMLVKSLLGKMFPDLDLQPMLDSHESYKRRLPKSVLKTVKIIKDIAIEKPGAYYAIDDFGEGLHPCAIRYLIDFMRKVAKEKNLTIIITSHVTSVINAFTYGATNVWVMRDGRPQKLLDLYDGDWLNYGSLGDRYNSEDIAPQTPEPQGDF